jgi:hypothetical protein
MICLIAIYPALSRIEMRILSAPYKFIHDGAIQVEEAVKYLLAGKNPYVEDYIDTPMRLWGGWTDNPALYHCPYLPFIFLLTVPFYMAFNSILGLYDQRFLNIIMFVIALLVISGYSRKYSKKLLLIILVGLNPLIILFL